MAHNLINVGEPTNPKTAVGVEIIAPTVHLNGTDRDSLLGQLRAAHDAVDTAISALSQAAPHGRDYYVQSDGEDGGGRSAIERAISEHRNRLARLESVQAELAALWQAVDAQERAPGR